MLTQFLSNWLRRGRGLIETDDKTYFFFVGIVAAVFGVLALGLILIQIFGPD